MTNDLDHVRKGEDLRRSPPERCQNPGPVWQVLNERRPVMTRFTTCTTGKSLSVIQQPTTMQTSADHSREQPYCVDVSGHVPRLYAAGLPPPTYRRTFPTAPSFLYYSYHPCVASAVLGQKPLTNNTNSGVFVSNPVLPVTPVFSSDPVTYFNQSHGGLLSSDMHRCPAFPPLLESARTTRHHTSTPSSSISPMSPVYSCLSDCEEPVQDHFPHSEDEDTQSNDAMDVVSPTVRTDSSSTLNKATLNTVGKETLLQAKGSLVEEKAHIDLRVSLQEMRSFASHFKERRSRLGYTQADVGLELRDMYGTEFSQATICRFESLSLSYENLCRWKSKLEQWLDVAESRGPGWCSDKSSLCSARAKQRRRTMIGPVEKKALVQFFEEKPRPHKKQIEKLASELGLSPQVIRTWIGNYRQKVRRLRTFQQLDEQ